MTFAYPAWTRVEPDPRGTRPAAGADLPFADPYWALARQWWIGEWDGHDGGAPASVRVESADARLALPGLDGVEHLSPSVAMAAPSPRPDARRPGDWREALSLADELLADLADVTGSDVPESSGGGTVAALADAFPLSLPPELLPRVAAERRIDGIALLDAVRRAAAVPGDPPAGLIETWAARHGTLVIGDELDPFAIETGAHGIALWRTEERAVPSLEAAAVRGAQLHWSDVTPMFGQFALPDVRVTEGLPSRVGFEGDLPPRWWTVEDDAVRWTASPAGPSDLGQLLVAAAFAEQGGVWWMQSFDVPANALVQVREVSVADGFGRAWSVEPLERRASGNWHLGAPDPRFVPSDLELVPTMLVVNEPDPLAGPPLEEVELRADEGDNLVWAIEELAQDDWGRGRRRRPVTPPPPVEEEERYVPRIPPPDGWIAYERADAARMSRAVLSGVGSPAAPRTSLVRPELRLATSFLPPAGRRVRTRWMLARAPSGRRLTWRVRRSAPALPRGGSGLLHDQILGPEL